MEALEQQFAAFRECFARLKAEIGKVFIGQSEVVERLLICLFCQGHVLLEGLPGLGKTLLIRTLSDTMALQFSRIQCTPDLMPADVIGTNLFVPEARESDAFRFRNGPIFANIVLADEINRATPKTQSAFLEAMQERHVTVLGTTYALAEPFLVLATQNPIELEGTYPLPEAQLDRFFFKLTLRFPDLTDLARIMDLTTSDQPPQVGVVCDRTQALQMIALVRKVKIAEEVKRYALRLMLATHPESSEAVEAVQRFVRYGASPRAAQSMILAGKAKALAEGRYNVAFDDLRQGATAALAHRIMINIEGEVARLTPEEVVAQVLQQVKP